MRLPSFTDLYYESPNLIGNRSLSAENQLLMKGIGMFLKHNT